MKYIWETIVERDRNEKYYSSKEKIEIRGRDTEIVRKIEREWEREK